MSNAAREELHALVDALPPGALWSTRGMRAIRSGAWTGSSHLRSASASSSLASCLPPTAPAPPQLKAIRKLGWSALSNSPRCSPRPWCWWPGVGTRHSHQFEGPPNDGLTLCTREVHPRLDEHSCLGNPYPEVLLNRLPERAWANEGTRRPVEQSDVAGVRLLQAREVHEDHSGLCLRSGDLAKRLTERHLGVRQCLAGRISTRRCQPLIEARLGRITGGALFAALTQAQDAVQWLPREDVLDQPGLLWHAALELSGEPLKERVISESDGLL